MNARTVSDLAVGFGILPGALLQTLVAQQAYALTNQGVCPMALTMSLLSAGHIHVTPAYVALALIGFFLVAAIFFAILWRQQGRL
jgi:hypothetical protein